ncbi:MAG TPA: TetR/AcrR family transcriptional regulator [Acidimicrobiales bacterium]|nr:TetR/AcrR family transcriptional regulator [Acidimicrobiales bacterium]
MSPAAAPARSGTSERRRVALIDAATGVLVAEPGASLAAVAAAAGVGRTTLHSYFPNRGELLRAVADRSLELCDSVVAEAAGRSDPDGGLRALVSALVPIGAHLAFLWRTPSFDHDPDLGPRRAAIEARILEVVNKAKDAGAIAPGRPGWWDVLTLLALVYVASESIYAGRLAALDAPSLVLGTLSPPFSPGRGR